MRPIIYVNTVDVLYCSEREWGVCMKNVLMIIVCVVSMCVFASALAMHRIYTISMANEAASFLTPWRLQIRHTQFPPNRGPRRTGRGFQ